MPLDASDYEKIQTIIDRIVNPLISKVDTIYGGLLPRVEYESRHRHIEQGITDNRADIRELRIELHSEAEKLRADNEKIWEEISKMKQDISDQRIATIRYMVGVFVGIVIAIVLPLIMKRIGG